MKQKVLERMAQLHHQATILPGRSQTTGRRSVDSLSQVVRNQAEAEQFREELNAAV